MPIYCINLKHRTDRKQHSLEQFKKMGILEHQVIYPTLTKDDRGGIYGCFDSHIKTWNHFYLYYPNQSHALIFEDDFIAPAEGKQIIKIASKFIQDHDVDLLFLHDLFVPVENDLNNELFTNGYGLGSHAYLISRRYIDSIIQKYGSLPFSNGRHIDYEKNINIKDKDNRIYSEKCFFLNHNPFTQQIGKSDNNKTLFDKVKDLFGMLDSDRTVEIRLYIHIVKFLKKYGLITDKYAKLITSYLND